ncbi:MAG TPA: hypothetical protein VD838_08720 [Anaeromyxobacteraceae bacterium]|nr:hypothetical protein [Anaeromyxobacteraceae bacterium]
MTVIQGERIDMPDGRSVAMGRLDDGSILIEFVRPNVVDGTPLVTPLRLSSEALDVLVALYLKTRGPVA